MVYPSLECARMLMEKGIDVTVVNARFAKPLDEELIIKVVENHQIVITVEDHAEVGGFGSAILELLVNKSALIQKIYTKWESRTNLLNRVPVILS